MHLVLHLVHIIRLFQEVLEGELVLDEALPKVLEVLEMEPEVLEVDPEVLEH